MLPQVGLIIPLYVVLAKYQPDQGPGRLHRRDPHLHDVRAAVRGLDAARLPRSTSRRSSRRRRWSTARAASGRSAGSCSRSSRPGSSRPSVFVFITSWNEFIFAYVLLNDQSKQTITVWLSAFYGTSRQVDWGGLMAGSILAAIPVLVFFGFVQRKIAFGLTAGRGERADGPRSSSTT